MNRTAFSLDVFGDRFAVTDIFERKTNSRQLEMMKIELTRAIESELTDRQRQMVTEFYFDGLTVTAIAKKHKLSKSTVSRHLSRARERLKGALKYGLYPIWHNPH